MARFTAGEVLARRYRLGTFLGRGGLGEVYQAEDLLLGETIALKLLCAARVGDAGSLAQMRNEVRVARQLVHPNLCRVHDMDDVGGIAFLTLQYVPGEDLARRLKHVGALPQQAGISVARQLCAGLAHMHERGFLHRDMKPSNVMIDLIGRVVITDFSLTCLAQQIRDIEFLAGTPAYMAPEQLAGQRVSVRSDIYALGLIMYEMFTGRRLHAGHTPPAARQAAPPSLQFEPGIDSALAALIRTCTALDPALRPACAADVAGVLQSIDAATPQAGEAHSPPP